MLSHVSFGVVDLETSIVFYDAVLLALGYVQLFRDESSVGYGSPGGQDGLALFQRIGASPPGSGFHLALIAPDRKAVDAFFLASLRHGGADLGAPGPRPHYGPGYYAAFVADPDGHKLEAVHQLSP